MSEIQHTPEPWRVGKLSHWRDYEAVREMVGPQEVVVDTNSGPYVLASCNYNFPQDAVANARRIVACVNACAGIPTDLLEVTRMPDAMGYKSGPPQTMADLKALLPIGIAVREVSPMVIELAREDDRRLADMTIVRDQLLAALEGVVEDVQGLIEESEGVAGLHRNGDLAPWNELEAGSRFERLSHLPEALAVIAAVKGGSPC